jgi:hypothetical protein
MDFIIELIGYLGSILVLISMLMSSVIKLRIINTVGSIIFTFYAFAIQTYPTAILNVILVGVNIYNIFKLLKSTKQYDLVEVKADDSFAGYFLEHYKNDIAVYFPEFKNNPELYDFAEKVTQRAEEMYDGYGGPLIEKNYNYNEFISDKALLLEVGNNKNTIEEANLCGAYFADVLASVIGEEQ